MATKYWVANQTSGIVPTANTAANWNDAADGTGSSGVPATTDDCIFGHEDTLNANLGNGECVWDLSQVNSITVNEDYRYSTTVTSDTISFDSASGNIQHESENFELLGFREGMWFTVSGSVSNDGDYRIGAIAGSVITTSGLTNELAGATVTISSESSIDLQATTCTINSLSLNGTIKNTTGSNKTLRFEGTPGTNNWYITNDTNAQVLNQDDITYNFNSAQIISFDDGPYPKTTVTAAANLQWDYKAAPTSAVHGAVSFYSLDVSNSSATAAGTLADPRNDYKKVFKLLTTSTFGFSPSRFDAGFSTWHFKMNANFSFPFTGNTAYGAGDGSFTAAWYNVVIDEPSTTGLVCAIDAGRTLNVNSLTVESGAQFQGYSTKGNDTTSAVVSINRPTINGAWNFSQVAEGVYSSVVTDTYPFTPSHGTAGRLQLSDYGGKFFSDSKLTWNTSSSTLTVDGKLTVTGLIDPTGMVFTPQAVNPETTNPLDTIWINSEDGHLYRGDRNVESTVHFNVRNDEGATIPLGAPLYSKGEIGGSNRIKVGIADASDPNKMPAIGLAMEEMNTTSTKDGNMILTGILNKNITITGVVEQDIIYVAPHGGSAPYLTITRPTSDSHLVQNVGVCVRQSATNVSQGMKVAAIGRTNDSPNCSFLMVNTESTHPQARRLVAGTNITLTDGGAGGDLTIAASGGGGGSGTVTSVAVSGSDGIEVDSGSPITTSGTVALGIDAPTLRSHINVEDGADVTDTANVTAAGALMDSEVINLADVKAFDPAAYATAAQGTLADTALQAPDIAPFVPSGGAVSSFNNDAGYLTELNFCQWNDISADITSNINVNTLINNWSYTVGDTDIRDAMSSGVWTCTPALAGKYLVLVKVMFGQGTLAETNDVRYSLQVLNYKNAGGGTPSSGTITNFSRHQNCKFYLGHILEASFLLTMADTDTFGVYAKILPGSGSGNFKIKSGSLANTSLTMIRIE